MARPQQPHDPMAHRHRPVDLVRRCKRMSWTKMGTYVPLTLVSHGRITKHSCMVSRPTGQEPVMSTPYPRGRNDDRSSSPMTGQPPSPEMLEFGPETIPVARPAGDHPHRPAAPIQRFNNKSLNWPAWFRHFHSVADVHGWSKEQRALQLVSYLDETAMNVAQELGDSDLYNYDVLVKLLGDRFDPASRVSASRSRFHARSRRHHEDADAFADALAELCRVGYPQSPPELRQELIAEQFVRGQSDPELKKYL